MRFKTRQPKSVFEPLRVDLVAESSDGVIELTIVQEYGWTGSDAQVESLQETVHTYVSFALDGGLTKQLPEAAGRPWRIVINSLSGEPDGRTQSVLDVLATRLPEHGDSLLIRTT